MLSFQVGALSIFFIIKPRRGRQRKVWSRMVDDLFKSLDIDKGEWLENIKYG